MALKREIRAIELQQKAVAHDRLVFDLQGIRERIEIALERVVMLVLHDRSYDAGRRRGEERLGEALPVLQRGAEIRALGFDQ